MIRNGISLVLLTVWPVISAEWVNNFDQHFTFTCPAGQSISKITSVHDNRHEDRRWSFECKQNPGTTGKCHWSGYVNEYDQLLEFHCPDSHFVHGIESIHDNGKEDRKFSFYCCEAPACTPLVNCFDTGYINSYDQPMDYSVPQGHVFYGAVSVHDNRHEDRIWKLHICPCTEAGGDIVG